MFCPEGDVANAKLIAAAPELVEALLVVNRYYNTAQLPQGGKEELWAIIEAALRKAGALDDD